MCMHVGIDWHLVWKARVDMDDCENGECLCRSVPNMILTSSEQSCNKMQSKEESTHFLR